MTAPKITQGKVSEVIAAVQWTAHGDDQEAARETLRRAKLTGPDCIAFLHYVLKSDTFASPAQRVRCASTLLEVGQFLSFEPKATGLFQVEDANGASEREAS
jgi:hypothetical protein